MRQQRFLFSIGLFQVLTFVQCLESSSVLLHLCFSFYGNRVRALFNGYRLAVQVLDKSCSLCKCLAYHLQQQVHTRSRLDSERPKKAPVHQESFSSPSFLSASLRDSFIGPRPENCTVMPWGRNMDAGFRLGSGDKARGAGFWAPMWIVCR